MSSLLSLDTVFPEVCAGLLLVTTNSCEAIFSRFTMTSMTGAWYTGLNPVETLLIGLIVLQVLAFRYYQILPLDITKLIQDHELVFGKRKRRRRSGCGSNSLDYLFEESLFGAVRKVDKYDCLLRTICELEYLQSKGEISLSGNHKTMIQNFKRSGMKRQTQQNSWSNPQIKRNYPTIPDKPIISVFEDAVLTGFHWNNMEMKQKFPYQNSSKKIHDDEFSCSYKYNLCPLTQNEIIKYANIVD